MCYSTTDDKRVAGRVSAQVYGTRNPCRTAQPVCCTLSRVDR